MEYSNLKLLAENKLSTNSSITTTISTTTSTSSNIEIKPSPNTGLRVPVKKWILYPESLSPLLGPIPWEDLPQYPIETLFGTNYTDTLTYLNFKKPKDHHQYSPDSHPSDSCPSTTPSSDSHSSDTSPSTTPSSDSHVSSTNSNPLFIKSRGAKTMSLIAAEAELLPFQNNKSNEILCQLIPKYRALGHSPDSIVSILQNHINNSPQYTNDLTDPDILERRVYDFFNCRQTDYIPEFTKTTKLPDHIKKIVLNHPFVRQRTKGIRQYFLGLINWKALHDTSLIDYRFTAKMDDIYPYYAINRKNNLYPLPSKVQKTWNKNYNTLLPWLKELGILKDSGLPYSPGANICKYYEIHLPTPSPTVSKTLRTNNLTD